MNEHNPMGPDKDTLRLFEQLPGLYLVLSPHLYILTASNSYLELTHKKREDITGKYVFDVFAYDYAISKENPVEISLRNVLINQVPHQMDISRYDVVHPETGNLELKYWHTLHTPVFDDAGHFSYIIHSTRDMTAQVLAENQLKDALNAQIRMNNREKQMAARMDRLFGEMPAHMALLNGEALVYDYINPAYARLFPHRTLLNQPLTKVLPEMEAHPAVAMMREVYRSGKSLSGKEMTVRIPSDEGTEARLYYFNYIYQPVFDEAGAVTGVLSFGYDVTEQVTARQSLQAVNNNLEQEVSRRLQQLSKAVLISEQQQKRLEDNELYLRSLLDTLPQQVWTAYPNGAVNYVNQVACSDFNQSAEDIISAGWGARIHPEDFEATSRAWKNSVQSGAPYMVEFRLRMKDGSYLWHLGRAIAIKAEGEIKHWIGTNTNIDLQKKGEEKRDEFISVASHELKTPLTSIKAFTQLLARSAESPKMEGYLQRMNLSTEKLERLINDMLDVSRINAGKLSFNKTTFNLSELIKECCEAAQLSSKTHEVVFESEGIFVYEGDRFRLEQVINNFLSNAIKYSPDAGKVVVNCHEEQNSLIVAVQDFGIGIATEHIRHLFDRYYRSDNTSARFGGLGLGLFISAEIIKGHGGTFWLESEKGMGSTFYFRLPLAASTTDGDYVVRGMSYQDQYIEISPDYDNQWLAVNWKGYQTVESVQHGGMQMVTLLKKSGMNKVLNDNRLVMGNWSEASDWAGKIWFPMMVDAGLKHFAWVFSESVFSQLAAEKSFDQSDGASNVQFFYDMAKAKIWLFGQ